MRPAISFATVAPEKFLRHATLTDPAIATGRQTVLLKKGKIHAEYHSQRWQADLGATRTN
jgi:hypothetical protein